MNASTGSPSTSSRPSLSERTPPSAPSTPPAHAESSAPPSEPSEAPAPASRLAELTYQLRFDQFKVLTSLSVAAAAGVLILMESGYVPTDLKSGLALGAFVLSTVASLSGQDTLIATLENGCTPSWKTKGWRIVATLMLGIGAGMLLQAVL
jgi:hypothetical protein